MICDIIDLCKYYYYRCKDGPFIIIFYKEDFDRCNFNLYKNLKFLERKYNDLPIIRFNYRGFIIMYPDEYVPSANHIMIIEKNLPGKYYEAKDINDITNILNSVREKRILHKRIFNKDFVSRNRVKMKPWLVNYSHHEASEINKYLDMTAEIQYKFPNTTAYLNLKRRKKNLNIKSSDKEKSYLPKSSKSILKNEIYIKSQTESKQKIEYNKLSDNLKTDTLKDFDLPLNHQHFSKRKYDIRDENILKTISESSLFDSNKHDTILKNMCKSSEKSITLKNKNKKYSNILSNENFDKKMKKDLVYTYGIKTTKEEFLSYLKLRENIILKEHSRINKLLLSKY